MTARNYFGILNLSKPEGVTSRQVVSQIHRITKPSKAGHAGTLDPLATGVLVICLGQATRLIEKVQNFPKTYRGKFLLGKRSDTDDITGHVEDVTESVSFSREEVESILKQFTGTIEQIPPRFSAVHINGKRAYDLARRNQEFEIKPKTVHVESIKVTGFSLPEIELEIICGSGTYIRSIGRDLGQELGCGALMTELVRTQIGPFTLADAVNPDSINAENIDSSVLPAVTIVNNFNEFVCSADDLTLLKNGRSLSCDENSSFQEGEKIRLMKSETEMVALATFSKEENLIKPTMVFTSQLDPDH